MKRLIHILFEMIREEFSIQVCIEDLNDLDYYKIYYFMAYPSQGTVLNLDKSKGKFLIHSVEIHGTGSICIAKGVFL
jgi:hypothetical protein